MTVVTRIQAVGSTKAAIHVDGHHWRDLPLEVVVSTGLTEGTQLDRPLLRHLRRSLRDVEAERHAARMLGRRDVSRTELTTRLKARGVTANERQRLLDKLEAAGMLDDQRLATTRAEQLADGGWGNAAIDYRLEEAGVGQPERSEAIASLTPERDRVAGILARKRKSGQKGAAFLSRRGFDPDVVEAISEAHQA